jgi:small subunit ribosomal protein S9
MTAEAQAVAKEKKRKPKKRGITAKSKKKTAVARAVIKKGKGIVRINKRNIALFEPRHLREMVEEPLQIAKGLAKEVDIAVSAVGGGFMSQAMAARTAIAKALVEYSGDEKLKKAFLQYDRMLLVDDIRRKEAKKPLGIGARRKKQKSKR